MKEIVGNIFDVECDAICVTTNSIVKANGELVMGAGLAKQFADRYTSLPNDLGVCVYRNGNHVYGFQYSKTVISFPTKHHWKDPSDLVLIAQSARELVQCADDNNLQKIVLPRPGCGLGQLTWAQVKPVLEPILDDRFYIITPKEGVI